MILVHSSTVAAILCQLPATSNPNTAGGMCYAKNRNDRVNPTLWYKLLITTNHSQAYNRHPWISTNQQQPITDQESQTHYPSMQVQIETSYPSMQSTDKLSQHTQQKILYKRDCKSPEQQNSGRVKLAVGVRRAQYKKISRANTRTLQEARQGIKHEA